MPDGFFCDDDINFGRAGEVGFEPFDTDVSVAIDPRTGRAWGDHGTASEALEYALDHGDGDLCNMEAFLRCWREGDLEEWPEFYSWLNRAGVA